MTVKDLSTKKAKEKLTSEADNVVGSNWCTMFIYNIPRGSLMVTLPGLVILVSGAAMTAYFDTSQSWLDGLGLIALVSLIVGGVWTFGALCFWVGVWCRYKPSMPAKSKSQKRSTINGVTNEGASLENVFTYPPDSATVDMATTSLNNGDHPLVQGRSNQRGISNNAFDNYSTESHTESVFMVS